MRMSMIHNVDNLFSQKNTHTHLKRKILSYKEVIDACCTILIIYKFNIQRYEK